MVTVSLAFAGERPEFDAHVGERGGCSERVPVESDPGSESMDKAGGNGERVVAVNRRSDVFGLSL
jgi:hypothetical protein